MFRGAKSVPKCAPQRPLELSAEMIVDVVEFDGSAEWQPACQFRNLRGRESGSSQNGNVARPFADQ
jgi:hypothetical protein